MWLFLSDSFLSVVDRGDPRGATLLLRARRRGDVEAVFPDAEVVEGVGTDYRYRARIGRKVENTRRGNFKSTARDDDRHRAYMNTWQVMMRFQDTDPTR